MSVPRGNDGSGYPDGDIGHPHQQDFLKTVASASADRQRHKGKICKIFKEYVDTNMTLGNIVWLCNFEAQRKHKLLSYAGQL